MKRIISYILLSVVTITLFADTFSNIYTPNGTSVEVWYRTEMSSDDISYCNTYYPEQFPNATFVSTATATYNCHSYAWNMVEGGPTCWLNATLESESSGYNNLKKFWTDDSYIETTEENATKVFYFRSDHSAVIKTAGSLYISKWGAAPLMEHAPGYGPYDDMINRRYYKINDEEDDEYNYVTGNLIPGSDIFPIGVEFEFTSGVYTEEDYEYEWSVDEDGESDAIASGKVSLNVKDSPYVAYVTFLKQGIFNVNLVVYDKQGRLRGNFTSQAIVQ